MISLVKYLFWFSAVAATGSSELVRTQRIVSAVLGQDVSFCCELTQPKDVLQVTWQKLTARKPENIATYNKRSGARIINSLSGRLGFLQTGLQKCSVAIKGRSMSPDLKSGHWKLMPVKYSRSHAQLLVLQHQKSPGILRKRKFLKTLRNTVSLILMALSL
nr:PREDICTED: OX-2 membrane glycoprotein-like [Lepisosteus oculatus]